jgi:cobyrinic acid a,c-diamide synthase
MESVIPRVVLAGAGSGHGKTTAACALMQAFTDMGVRVGAFKCGPDYIDPMFHRHITGRGVNLDPFFFSADTLGYLLDRYGTKDGINIIEGVMGYYDGVGLSDEASTYAAAKAASCPVVLILGAGGAALSLLAELEGFARFRPDSGIRGVVFNRCPPSLYPSLAAAVNERFGGGIRPLGFLPVMPDCSLESRHLGLVTADEVEDLDRKLAELSRRARESVDLEGLLELARGADRLSFRPPELPKAEESVRIAVARDRAFCFYYEDSLDLLRDMGAELISFSPLDDERLPEDVHGLYLGGGYPELYADRLSENLSMRSSILDALKRGRVACIAECGGFMYLTQSVAGRPMVGFLEGECRDNGKLTRFGYIRLRAEKDNMLCRRGGEIAAHEFHHWDCTLPGADFTAEKPTGRKWSCGTASDRLYAGFPHFNFLSEPGFALDFYKTCLEVKLAHD